MATTRPKPKRYVRRLQMRKPCVHGVAGIELRPHQVLIRPLVTEKGTHQSSKYNAYSFEVSPLATKIQIANAVAELFNVKVDKVRTQTRKGKKARYKQVMGVQSTWKKAIVTLDVNDKIDFF